MKKAATRRVSRKQPRATPASTTTKKAAKKRAAPKSRPLPGPDEPARVLPRAAHEAFVQFLLKGLNQTNAYLAVYGGDKKSAEKHGSRLASNGKVKARLEWLLAQQTEKVNEKAALDKARVLEWCARVLETPVTTVAHAVAKHQVILLSERDPDGELPAAVAALTDEEKLALLLAHEINPSEYGTKVKMVSKMDSMKLAVDVLGLKKADQDNEKNGRGIVDGLAALAAAVRARAGMEAAP